MSVTHERLDELVADYNGAAFRQEMIGAETSFLMAEQLRGGIGMGLAKRLYDLKNGNIAQVVGMDKFPQDFHYGKDWLVPTGVHEIEDVLDGPNKTKMQLIGIRIQDNVVNRKGEDIEEHGYLSPVGGGVRVMLVEVEPDALGNCRIPDIEAKKMELKDEGGALAAAMVPKNTGLDFRWHLINVLNKLGQEDKVELADKIYLGGGSKGDILLAVPKGIIGKESKEYVARALESAGYHWANIGAISWQKDRGAGDKNTTADIADMPLMDWLSAGVERAYAEKGETDLALARAAVSGKKIGGLKARGDATGLGTYASLEALAKYTKEGGKEWLRGKSVFFRGCGSAAKRAIVEAAENGMKVQAIAATSPTKHAIITSESGFTKEDAEELFQFSVNDKGNVADWARQKEAEGRDIRVYHSDVESTDELNQVIREYWREKSPDVIFESATQQTVNAESAVDVPDGAILVEGGNGVTTPIASDILNKKGVQRIPGILANAGGVFASWFEWAQPVLKVNLTTDKATQVIEEEIRELMDANVKASLDIISGVRTAIPAGSPMHGVNMEQAYYAYAMLRGIKDRDELKQRMSQN